MSVLDRIAHSQGRHIETLNQELARDLASRKDRTGIREIAENLWNEDKRIQSDCIKVLYEVGYLQPSLIARYVEDFLKLLKSRNNRMVWGGMIALGTVAGLKTDIIFIHLSEIYKAVNSGSVISVDNGVKTLALVASRGGKYNQAVFPYLLHHLKTCRPKDVAQHSEKILPAVVTSSNKKAFIAVLEKRMKGLSGSGIARVKKVMKAAEAR